MVTVPYLGVTVVLGGWIDVECDGHACLGRDRGLFGRGRVRKKISGTFLEVY